MYSVALLSLLDRLGHCEDHGHEFGLNKPSALDKGNLLALGGALIDIRRRPCWLIRLGGDIVGDQLG